MLRHGHAVHLGLTGAAAERDALEAHWAAWPALSLGHAVPRRDGWARLAPTLDAQLARALPPDPGILVYLGQLDLDLVLVSRGALPGSIEGDYVIAARALALPATVLADSAEDALAQASPGAVGAPAREGGAALARPALWAARAWDTLTRPPPSTGEAQVGPGVLGRLQEIYAAEVFPALAAALAAVAPRRRPLVRATVAERLERSELANQIAAEAVMAAAAEGSGPVALGPWWGESELELLYWIPFLRWWRRHYRVEKERLIAISTGGAGAWYEGVAGRCLDVAELFDAQALEEFERDRLEKAARRKKRYGATEADRQVVKRLNRRLGFRGVRALPAWVVAVAFQRFWAGQDGPAVLDARMRRQALRMKPKQARRQLPGLPERYLAVGLPAVRPSDPRSMEAWCGLVRAAGEGHDLVLLAEPQAAEWANELAPLAAGARALVLEPASAKASASAAIAAAEAYVGAGGWMAYAAAAFGRRAISVNRGRAAARLADHAAAAWLFDEPPLELAIEEVAAAARWLKPVVARRAPAEPAH